MHLTFNETKKKKKKVLSLTAVSGALEKCTTTHVGQ